MITRLKKITLVAMLMATASISAFCSPEFVQKSGGGYLPHSGQSIFDVINQQDIVEMTLTAEIDSLIETRKTKEYRAADISFKDGSGIVHNYQIRVKPRGKFRRRICDFPPLKIKFSKEQLEAAGLSKHNDLKLVTHCMEDELYNENLLLREYLTYKLYNELSPNSFRTQLVKITYQDSHDKRNKQVRYGFLIEDVDELADRMGGKECDDCFGLTQEQINTSQENVVALFQYMIGNVDWNLDMHRNIKLIKKADGSHIAVPYDFDYSVLVGAPYLRPNTDLQQTTAMERIFLGRTQESEKLNGTISYFKTKRKALLDIIRSFHYLNKQERFEIELYIESFFDQIDNRNSVDQMIFGKKDVGVR
jgi:hypothetical protein